MHKQINWEMGEYRIRLEYVNAKLNIFRIFATLYRNRCKCMGLGLNLIAAIYSTEMIKRDFFNRSNRESRNKWFNLCFIVEHLFIICSKSRQQSRVIVIVFGPWICLTLLRLCKFYLINRTTAFIAKFYVNNNSRI